MANLNYQKFFKLCNKHIDKNPYIYKAISVHIAIIVVLYALSLISLLKFDNTVIQAQVSVPKQMQVIQATSISSANLNSKIWAYENNREELIKAREDVKSAKDKAVQQDKNKKALEKKRIDRDILKSKQLEKKRLKKENLRKDKLIKDKKIADAKKRIKDKADAKKKAEIKARDDRIAKSKADALAIDKAEAQAAAKKQIMQNQAQTAISGYISKYQILVGQNWIKDSCRGIYNLPRAIIRNGRFIKLTGTSGNFSCDQSLIRAIKNTTAPVISNSSARQTVQNENISFIFSQK